ncbi:MULTISPECIES: TetR/AcrR family transcriptional regulator [Microbacterium]|jgi:AcrR family transcriptional regulator|uniref:TetR/AcrR family transcriptional regulator n=1 Tax=Microbacterium TaxID=33882 RepID=UPI001E285662|nr:TetR/AcrR family transcriptional regulator [Microbacterium nymphoidis]MCD2497386.1 TetR/AcrR family transcriptional regulator [Microbacterium nymphoidis]
MPKISAATVAEHRTAQHAALLAAAEELLLSDGIDAVTPSAVTSRAGLARSTFYEYFPSKDDLLVALAREAFELWTKELAQSVALAEPGREQLRAYIAATIRLAADGRHDLATVLRGVSLSPKSQADIVALHTALDDPLGEILRELVGPQARTAAPLIHGLLGSAMKLATAGRPAPEVTEIATRMVLDGIGVAPAS